MKRNNKLRQEVKNPLPLSVVDLTTLLFNLWEGSRDKKIGWESASCTLNNISRNLDGKIYLNEEDIESALWSSNLMRERKKFWDIKGRTFEQFVKSIFPHRHFNKDYNFVEGDRKNARNN